MHQYASHHHQDHHCWPGCNVLCYSAMNRTLNTDMMIISFSPDIFQPAFVNYSGGQRLRLSYAVEWC